MKNLWFARICNQINSKAGSSMAKPKQIPNPIQFFQQVRSEIAKVVWPTRREVMLTTIMVFIMAGLTAIFFSIVDLTIRSALTAVLGMFG